jgi:hypothetical protein
MPVWGRSQVAAPVSCTCASSSFPIQFFFSPFNPEIRPFNVYFLLTSLLRCYGSPCSSRSRLEESQLQPINPLESAFTQTAPLSPLESAFTKNAGGVYPLLESRTQDGNPFATASLFDIDMKLGVARHRVGYLLCRNESAGSKRNRKPDAENVNDYADHYHFEREGELRGCRKRDNNPVHEEVHGNAIQRARGNGVPHQERSDSACRDVDSSSRKRYDEVKEKTKQSRGDSAAVGSRAKQSAGNALQQAKRFGSEIAVNHKRGRNVQNAASQPAQENGKQCAGSLPRLRCDGSVHDARMSLTKFYGATTRGGGEDRRSPCQQRTRCQIVDASGSKAIL